jgi:hypothetical protein
VRNGLHTQARRIAQSLHGFKAGGAGILIRTGQVGTNGNKGSREMRLT